MCGALQAAVDGRGDLEAGRIGREPEAADHLRADHFGDVGRIQLLLGTVMAAVNGSRHCLALLLGGNVPEFEHAAQDIGAALRCRLRAGDRVENGGTAGYPGNDGRIGQADRVERLAEIGLRGGGHTVGMVAEKRGIEEDVEDFFLGEFPLDAQRKNPLLEFSNQRPVAGEKVLAGDLLGDGAAALVTLAGIENEQQDRPQRALVVDARMLEEAIVLRREHGLDDHRRHVFEVDRYAPFAELGDQPSVAAVDGQRDLNAHVAQLFRLG